MSRTVHTYARFGALAAACVLSVGACLALPFATMASAASPHVSSTVDTASCAACHTPHHSTSAMLLHADMDADDSSSTCRSCHDGSDDTASNITSGSLDSFGQASGHSLTAESSGTALMNGCGTCHETHGSSSEKRRIPAANINGVPVDSAGKTLCLACHDSSEAWFGPGYPSTAQPVRDATGYPVVGTWVGSNTYGSSSNAHSRIPEATQTVGVSEPIRREQGDCLYCHAAHGSANSYDGLLTTYTVPAEATLASDQADGTYAALCFTCHGGSTPSGFSTAPVDIKRSATATGGAGGHAIVTSGGILPVGAPLPCFECHNPHGSQRGNDSQISDERGASLATTSAAGVRAFCFTCHATSDTIAGWDSDAATFTPVPSADEVVGIPRDGGVLRLTVVDGHSQEDTASCYECHGDSYDPGGHNVHNPGDGTVAMSSPSIALLPISNVASTSTDATGSLEPSASVPATGASEQAMPSTDTVPPVTTSDAQPTYLDSATITLTAVDDTGGVGVAETYYVLDGGEVTSGTVVSTSTLGAHALTFWSVDAAGNEETPRTTVVFTIDEAAFARVFAIRLERIIADGGG